ncbi:TPA: terminase large subunit [Pseudomonas aeruginosa]|nr:terminase large subunit [Pseudomonas aeruginosa]HEJ2068539.1 terminase large subunit [Pseudomonas aeruginosa]HEJ4469361.1 terminase large subunit [Pseudomonas aeruginosa]HEJ5099298.1 terminase large subunit [Pseudomonas aeruginosa]HEJ5111248.1 terminase large subunit [Pseudomonas aeruginosa]
MQWTTACPDWESRIEAGKSLVPLKPIFQDQADDALDVFCNLRMVDATGSPLMGDTCRPWVLDLVAVLFGSYDEAEGRRLITNYLLMVSKKNGKSTIAAGIMLTALILNARPSGEFIILAPTKEAADNAYKPIRDMIKADDELEARFHEQEHIRTITDRLNKATLKVVAADSATVTGKKAIGVFIDELHEFGKQAKAAAMLTEATGGLASRPEGFVFYCTTQSNEPPAGVFKAKLNYARSVRDGRIEDKRFLPVIYEFPQHMLDKGMHRDLSNAYITNPNWGLSVDEQVIAQKYQEAQAEGENAVRDFLAKHLNVEIGLALRSDRWPGADFWEDAVEPCTFDQLIERCEVIDLGIDGGGLDDLLGAYAVGREKDTNRKLGWGHAWAHPSVLERRKEIAPALHDFAKAGHLTLVKRVGDDVEELADIAEQIHEAGLLDKIGCDPVGLGAILDKLEERGIPNDKIVGISQGWKLGGAIKTAERWLAEGSFAPAAQPMMAWCVGNARVEPRANSILITKQASGSAKIDPLMAMFNAVTLMALNPPAATKKFQMFVLG